MCSLSTLPKQHSGTKLTGQFGVRTVFGSSTYFRNRNVGYIMCHSVFFYFCVYCLPSFGEIKICIILRLEVTALMELCAKCTASVYNNSATAVDCHLHNLSQTTNVPTVSSLLLNICLQCRDTLGGLQHYSVFDVTGRGALTAHW